MKQTKMQEAIQYTKNLLNDAEIDINDLNTKLTTKLREKYVLREIIDNLEKINNKKAK